MRTALQLVIVAAIAISVVVGLFLYQSRNKNLSNGFTRILPPHMVSDLKEFELPVNSYYIAGVSHDSVYLGNTTVPDHVLSVHRSFTGSTEYAIGIDPKDTMWGANRLYVDSSAIYIMQTARPKVRVSGRNAHHVSSKNLRIDGVLDLYPLYTSSVIGKRLDLRLQQVSIFKAALDSGVVIREFIIGKNHYDLFYSDGSFAFSPAKDKFFYVSYYSNRFLCLDSSLNILYTAKTIDTFSTPRISVAASYSNSRIGFSSPPKTVNRYSVASDKLLFIQSAVRSNNETDAGFKSGIVVDTYSTISGNYLFSFYLPRLHGHMLSSIFVEGNHLFFIYDKYLASVKVNPHLFRGRLR